MLDARNVYRKVTRKIFDFSPEQLANLTAIVWLYRGETERFVGLVEQYLTQTLDEANTSKVSLDSFVNEMQGLLDKLPEIDEETSAAFNILRKDITAFEANIDAKSVVWQSTSKDNAGLLTFAATLEPMAETSRDLIKQIDQLYKFAEKQAKDSGEKGLTKLIKTIEDKRKNAVEQLKLIRYFYKQAHWLQERFPDAELQDIAGLVKLVDMEELKAADWSLTPGRYVGVAPELEDEDFDFEETLRDIHIELKGLNEEAAILAAQIQKNFEELGI